MKLIVGLGNPGPKYENTRHNIGFMAIDYALENYDISLHYDKKFEAEILKINETIFLKPQTYMNLSGNSVLKIKDFYKIDEILVIHDDLDLNFGAIRFKCGGSSGGHNGLKSIDNNIGNNYLRLRIGIGHPKNNDKVSCLKQNSHTIFGNNVVDYVLQKFKDKEMESLNNIFKTTKDAIEAFKNGSTLEELQNKWTCKSII